MKQESCKIEDLKIREAKASDWKDLRGLSYESAVLHHEAEPKYFKKPKENDPSFKEPILERLKNKDSVIFVGTFQNEILGVIEITIKNIKENVAMYPRRTANIGEFVVKKEFQNLGIGKILMTKALDWIHSHGNIQDITLNVWSFNKKAISFYKDLGLQERNSILSKML